MGLLEAAVTSAPRAPSEAAPLPPVNTWVAGGAGHRDWQAEHAAQCGHQATAASGILTFVPICLLVSEHVKA